MNGCVCGCAISIKSNCNWIPVMNLTKCVRWRIAKRVSLPRQPAISGQRRCYALSVKQIETCLLVCVCVYLHALLVALHSHLFSAATCLLFLFYLPTDPPDGHQFHGSHRNGH